MVERDVGELFAHYPRDGGAPESRSLEHVCLVDRCQLAPAFARDIRGDARHALDLRGRIDALINRTFAAIHSLTALVAEIHAARQLADEDQVHSLQPLRAQWRCRGQRWMDAHGTKVGVHLQLSAQAKQSLLRALTRVGIVPARATDCAEENGVGILAKIDRLWRQWSAARIERASANQAFAQLYRMAVALSDRAKNARAFGDDLGTDAVARKQRDR